MSEHLNKVPYPVNDKDLINLFHHDIVYTWLLLHSHFNELEHHNYIYKKEFTIISIARSCGKNRNTVTNHIKKLKEEGYITDCGDYYLLKHYSNFLYLHGKTLYGLITLQINDEMREGVITAYAYLWNWFNTESQYKDNPKLKSSFNDLGKQFGLKMGHNTDYDKMRTIITILCGAGIIDYDIKTMANNALGMEQIYITKVNWKAPDKWLKLVKGF